MNQVVYELQVRISGIQFDIQCLMNNPIKNRKHINALKIALESYKAELKKLEEKK